MRGVHVHRSCGSPATPCRRWGRADCQFGATFPPSPPAPRLCCLQAARGAQLVAAIEDEHHLPGGDARWFLD